MNLLRVKPLSFVLRRGLSGLKQFYMAVHPDLFGDHPVEKLVNETSLKSLNAFVDTLERREFVSANVTLPFFVKRTERETLLKQIRVELTYRIGSVAELSGLLLEALSLPNGNATNRDNLHGVEVKGNTFSSRYTVEMDHVDVHSQQAYANGFTTPDSFAHVDRKPPFSEWLGTHWREAVERERAFATSANDIETMRAALKARLGAAEIVWLSGWEADHFAVALRSLQRIVDAESLPMQQRISEVVAGRLVVFTSQTGVTRCGTIALNPDNVPATWRTFLVNARASIRALDRLPRIERALSLLLRGSNVVRTFDCQLATVYELRLRSTVGAFGEHLRQTRVTLQETDLKGLSVTLGSSSESLQLLSDGTCLVPTSYSPQLVLAFLSEHSATATRRAAQFARDRNQFDLLARSLRDLWALRAVQLDENVTPGDALQCVDRIGALPRACATMLRGRSLRICAPESTYTIRKDGEIWIPCSM